MADVPDPNNQEPNLENQNQQGIVGEGNFSQSFDEDIKLMKELGFDIDVNDTIGVGAYGVVYRGTYGQNAVGLTDQMGNPLRNVSVGMSFACKYVDFEAPLGPYDLTVQELADSYIIEKRIMNIVNHPNITPLRMAINMGEPNTYTNHSTGVPYSLPKRLYLIMDLAELGPLNKFMKDNSWTITSSERIKLFVDSFIGLKYLHDNNIAHGDIHFGNVLIFKDSTGLTRYTAKWTDFGKGCWSPNNPNDPELILKKEQDCVKFCSILDEIIIRRRAEENDSEMKNIFKRFIQMRTEIDSKQDLNRVFNEFKDIFEFKISFE